jgi:hypothetical protein
MLPTTLMTWATRVTGTFRVLGWEEAAYEEVAGLPTLVQAAVSEELDGGIVGEASISYLMIYRDDGVASFVGLVRVVGRIGQRLGTFVMQETGTFEGGVAMGHWTILPGSSTGQLRGIRGEGAYTAGREHVSYSLTVSYAANGT